MRKRSIYLRLLLLLSVVASSLIQAEPSPAAPAVEAKAAVTARYSAKGVLLEIRAGGRKALIAHEAIANFMPAMTMEFDVEISLEGLHAGDPVSFRLSLNDEHGWIDQIQRSAREGPPVPRQPPTSPADGLLGPGDLLPDCPLLDSSGRPFHLGDLRGQALALSFIFTRCPFPDYCPRLNTQFAAVQKALLSEPGAPANWQLCSISLDPDYDTPERLGAYARRYEPDAKHWRFATGEANAIAALGAALGLSVAREGGALPNHNLRTVIVDGEGRIRRIFVGNAWSAEELKAELLRAAR